MSGDEESHASSSTDAAAYVATPYGLMSAAGRWYHIPEEGVREYAGGVLDHVSLDQLVRWADAWMDSPRTVTLWALPLLLWAVPLGWAVLAAVGVYCGWTLASPSFPGVGGVRVVSVLRNVYLQGGYYVATLSFLAAAEQLAAVGVGLTAFVLFRWGIVGWTLRAALRSVRRRLYPLPVADQVLRGLIVRAALKYRVSVPQVDAMTSDILDNWGAQSESSSDSEEHPAS